MLNRENKNAFLTSVENVATSPAEGGKSVGDSGKNIILQDNGCVFDEQGSLTYDERFDCDTPGFFKDTDFKT